MGAIVTGASRYLGSNICKLLRDRRFAVLTFVRQATEKLQGPGILTFITEKACRAAFQRNPNYVFHLSGATGHLGAQMFSGNDWSAGFTALIEFIVDEKIDDRVLAYSKEKNHV